ncbi:XRE family transcriptional regulator [Bradyrhizobium sp. LCT2]|nr:XRE family transcriptional regulator [Bradyrhizobium sp. LCT2]
MSSLVAMDLKEIMAINLRRIRHVKKMTQEELADRAGLSVRYIGAIERADVSASVTVLGRIAEALGVEATDLIKRTAVHPHSAR